MEKPKDKKNETKYVKTTALSPGNIFFYHVSMQAGAGTYNAAAVEDNAGSCGGGVGVSGNPSLAKSVTTTTVQAGSRYNFNLTYTNLTNVATEVDIQRVVIKFKNTFGPIADPNNPPVDGADFLVAVYPDYNCNKVQDPGEDSLQYTYQPDVEYDAATDSFEVTFHVNAFDGAIDSLPAFGTGCFVAEVTLPEEGYVTRFKISFETAVFFVHGKEPCEPSCGGKPVNTVGFVEEEVGGEPAAKVDRTLVEQTEINNVDIQVYPNPSKGSLNVVVPGNFGNAAISLEDMNGRTVQRMSDSKSGTIKLTNLKPGFYILRMQSKETGKMITKKIVVQR